MISAAGTSFRDLLEGMDKVHLHQTIDMVYSLVDQLVGEFQKKVSGRTVPS